MYQLSDLCMDNLLIFHLLLEDQLKIILSSGLRIQLPARTQLSFLEAYITMGIYLECGRLKSSLKYPDI